MKLSVKVICIFYNVKVKLYHPVVCLIYRWIYVLGDSSATRIRFVSSVFTRGIPSSQGGVIILSITEWLFTGC